MCVRICTHVHGTREQVTEARPVGDGTFAYTIRNGENIQVPRVCELLLLCRSRVGCIVFKSMISFAMMTSNPILLCCVKVVAEAKRLEVRLWTRPMHLSLQDYCTSHASLNTQSLSISLSIYHTPPHTPQADLPCIHSHLDKLVISHGSGALFEPEIFPRCADIVPEVAQRCSGKKGKRYCCSPYAIILQNAPYSPLFVQTHRLHAQQAMQSLLSAYGSSSSESDSD